MATTKAFDYRGEIREWLIGLVQFEATMAKLGITYWGRWAHDGAEYVDAMAELLIRAMRDPKASPEAIREALDVYKRLVRDLAGLPAQAAVDFNLEMENLRRRTQAKSPGESR